jgi:hypothetical protein
LQVLKANNWTILAQKKERERKRKKRIKRTV